MHKSLHVPAGEKIPAKKLAKAAHSDNPKLAKRAHLAETLKGMHHAHGGKAEHGHDCRCHKCVGGKAGKDELFAALKKHTTGPNDAAALAGVVFPGFSPDGYLHLQTIESSIAWYFDKGLIKAKPKLSDLVDYQYLEYALERLGRRGPPQKVP